jgi:hypothetical protein
MPHSFMTCSLMSQCSLMPHSFRRNNVACIQAGDNSSNIVEPVAFLSIPATSLSTDVNHTQHFYYNPTCLSESHLTQRQGKTCGAWWRRWNPSSSSISRFCTRRSGYSPDFFCHTSEFSAAKFYHTSEFSVTTSPLETFTQILRY